LTAKNNIDKKELKKQYAIEKAQEKKKREALESLKPLLFSFVLWGALMGIVHTPIIYNYLTEFFVEFVVNSTVFIGNLLFFPVVNAGAHMLNVAGFQMRVIFECTAYNFYLFAFSLAVFGKWTIKDKMINLLIFILSIFILNVFRFIVMGYIGKFFPQAFHQIHDYVWTVIFGLAVFILYIWRNDKSQLNDA